MQLCVLIDFVFFTYRTQPRWDFQILQEVGMQAALMQPGLIRERKSISVPHKQDFQFYSIKYAVPCDAHGEVVGGELNQCRLLAETAFVQANPNARWV